MKEIAAKLTAYYDNLKNLYEGVEDAEGGSGDNPSLAFGSDVVGSDDENQERRTPRIYDQEEEDESDPVSNHYIYTSSNASSPEEEQEEGKGKRKGKKKKGKGKGKEKGKARLSELSLVDNAAGTTKNGPCPVLPYSDLFEEGLPIDDEDNEEEEKEEDYNSNGIPDNQVYTDLSLL